MSKEWSAENPQCPGAHLDEKTPGTVKGRGASKPLETFFEVVITFESQNYAEEVERILDRYSLLRAEVREVAK